MSDEPFDIPELTPFEKGIDSLEALQFIMENAYDMKDRLSAAKEIAKYNHRQLRPVDNFNNNNVPTINILMPTSTGQSKSICLKKVT